MPSVIPKKLPQHRTQFVVAFDAAETSAAEEKTLQKMGAAARIPGFRPGKAPPDAVRERVDAKDLLEEMVRELVSPLLQSLPREHALKPILHPRLAVESTNPVKVTITYVEQPAVTVKGADKISIPKKESKADEKDVDRMVRYLLEQERTFTEEDRPAKDGDRVTMDFHGTGEDGQEVAGIRSRNYDVVLGSKTLLPGFEDALVGMKKGDAKDIPLVFPKEYHAEHLSGKPVTFHVNVTKVDAVRMPEFTDAFAKEHGLGETTGDVKKRIEDSMRAQEESLDRQRRERELFDTITKATKVDLAPELVEQTVQGLVEDLDESLRRQHSSLEEWMKKTQKSAQDVEKDMREQAEKRLRLRFGVEKLLEDRKIEVTDEEVETAVAAMGNEPGHEGHDHGKGSGEFEQIRWQKRVEKLVEGMLA
ncbi:MAG: trigger factor [Candidatus Peribacteraceae bacterium]|nr:trigger factor [Candidatus Peribacteraceae bacterium]